MFACTKQSLILVEYVGEYSTTEIIKLLSTLVTGVKPRIIFAKFSNNVIPLLLTISLASLKTL